MQLIKNTNILSFIFLLGIMRAIVCEDTIKQYLSGRFTFINNVLDNHRISTRGIKNGVKVIDENTITIPDAFENIVTFKKFNNTFLLSDYEIFKFVPDDNSIQYVTTSNLSEMEEYIAFIRTIEYNNEGMMFVAYKNKVSMIYGYSNYSNDHHVIQSIQNLNHLTDAKFFFNNGSLYLTISSMYGVSMVPITIYKWMGTHFDQIAEELIQGTIQLETFKYDDSEIIVLLRNVGVEKTNSYVYEFKMDKLRKIQILDNYAPRKMKKIVQGDKIYLIIIDEGQKSIIYIWSTSELVPINNFQSSTGVSEIIEIQEIHYTVIFVIYMDKLAVYTMYLNELNHVTTYFFQAKFNQILMVLVPRDQNIEIETMLIFGFNSESKLTISRITFMASEMTIVGETRRKNDLIECMDELEDTLEDSVNGITTLEYRVKKILKTNEPLEYDGRLNVAAPVVAQFAKIENSQNEDANIIIFQIREIEHKIDQLTSIIRNVLNEESMIIDNKLVILGSLNAYKLKSQRTQMKKINGINWNPQQWLRYSNSQIISTPIKIKKMFVKELVQNMNGMFNDIFIRSGNQKIIAPVTCDSLKSSNIYTQNINYIPVHNIYVKNLPKRITGDKVFNNIFATDVQLDFLIERNISQIIKLFSDPKGSKYAFPQSIKITSLIVEKINNVDWNEFSKSVFKIGTTRVIEGNLNFNVLRANSLKTNLLSGYLVENLLTVSSNQVINSSISFGVVNVKEVNCNTINGLNLQEDVAYSSNDENVIINGLVTTKSGKIRGALNRTGSIDNWNLTLGSNTEDLLQIYNSKVKIIGNLHIQNVHLPQTAKLFVSGNEFNQDHFNEYWQKTTNQRIPTHFEAQMGITTPHLSTKSLNYIAIDLYMINNLDDRMPSNYIFQNATVIGNIVIHEHHAHTPDLEMLSDNAIKTDGTFVIRGVKDFTGKLSVDHLKTDLINTAPVADIYTVYSKQLSAEIKYETLILEGTADAFAFSTKTINGIDFGELYNKTLFTNEPIEAENMDFVHAAAEDLFTTKINSKLFTKYQLSLSNVNLLNNVNLLKIRGNAIVNNLNKVDYINDISVSNKIKKFQEGNPYDQIEGNVIFEGKVQVKNLLMKYINDIDFITLFPRILNLNLPQNITAKHTFKVITTENFISPMVNDVDMINLIDTQSETPQSITIKTLQLSRPLFSKSLFTNYLVCDFVHAFRKLHDIPVRYWKKVVILGDAAVSNSDSDIGNLVSNSVRNNKDNVITSSLTLNHVHADEIIGKNRINGIQLKNIMEDALLVNAVEQVVTGFKTFNNIKTTSAQILDNVEIPSINRLDILKINNSTISKQNINNMILRGRKTFFGGLEVEQILTPTAAAILPENLVSLKNLETIPNATFDTLVVQDSLNINFANGRNFNEFIYSRLLLNAPEDQVVSAIYFFDEIDLNGPVRTTTFNGINVEDIVFDEGVQTITAPKKFKFNLNILGDAVIYDVNGFLVNEIYTNAIILGENANIKSDICLKDTSQINGNIIADKINDIPLESLKDQLKTQNGQIRVNIVRETIQNIETLINESMAIIQRLPDQYLYLEKSDKLHIEIPNSVDANIAHVRDNLMIHVQTQDSGEYCSLPIGCTCPNQITFVVSPGYSVNQIDNKYGQRVFSYQDQDVAVHVVTTSRSSSTNCRTNVSAIYEFTTLSWTAQAGININQTIFPEKITGYISDVKFFSRSSQVYAVIGRFYDPIINTRTIESLVVRFCKLKGTIDVVQRISTTGASILHIFYTAQGINLVIGNRAINPSLINGEDSIDIYRFNPQTSLFDSLRRIPSTGCLSITSLVFGFDSLIIMAQVDAPMEVLKYDHTYDNFHFYQNMLEKYPVVSVSSFYTGGVGMSDANLLAVGYHDELYVFSYQFLSGWKLESESRIEGIRNVVSFTFNMSPYVFVASTNGSIVLTVVKHGYK